MKKIHYLVHSLAYYIAWFACLTLAARGFAWLSSLVVLICVLAQLQWQYKTKQNTKGLWFLLGLIVIISTLVDSFLVFSGIIVLSANPFAPYVTSPWLITIWISFTVSLYATLDILFDHLILLGILSFSGFVFAFALGAKMGAVYFPYGYLTCLLIGAIWFILLPCSVGLYQRIMRHNKSA